MPAVYRVPAVQQEIQAEKERYIQLIDAYFAKIEERQGYVDYEIGYTWHTSIVAHEIVDEWHANVLLYHSSNNSAVEYFDIFSGPDEICLQLQALFDECDKSRL